MSAGHQYTCWSVVMVNVNHLLERGDGMVNVNHLLTFPIQVQLLAHERRDHLGLGPVFLGAMETGEYRLSLL